MAVMFQVIFWVVTHGRIPLFQRSMLPPSSGLLWFYVILFKEVLLSSHQFLFWLW